MPKFVSTSSSLPSAFSWSLGARLITVTYNNLLIRHKNTKPQAGLEFNKRINNVKSAFKINPDLIEQINNKNILLIDDVMTTGSTIDSCTKTLLKSGARNVYVLTIAMTVKD